MSPQQEYIKRQKNWPTRVLAKRQIDFVSRHIGGRVLDIGCGEGVIGATFPNVTSCDITDYNKYDLSVDVCRAEKLPYPDKSFDTVCLIGVIEHTDDSRAVIDECRRVCRGRLIITYPKGRGWRVLRAVLPRPGVKLHADFEMNGQMANWTLVERQTMIPSFFIGEVYT
jgi:SAM-dependent methyltransferase